MAESPVGTGTLPGTLCLLPHSVLDYSRDLMHTCGKLAFNCHSGNDFEYGVIYLMSGRLRASEVTSLPLLSSFVFETNNEEEQPEPSPRHQWGRCLPCSPVDLKGIPVFSLLPGIKIWPTTGE